MKIAIMIFTVVATLICICACQLAPTTAPTDPTQATTIPTEAQPTQQPTQPTEPDPRIAEMQALLEWKGGKGFYNDALTSEYATPADVNLFYLFYDGFKDEPQKPTEDELVWLEGKMGQYWKEMDLIRLPVDKMNAVLTELFGITLEQSNGVGLDSLVYLEETDCYYHAITGTHLAEVTVGYVETLYDGSILVQYSAGYEGNFMVKLMPKEDGGYRILSNTKIDNIYNEVGLWNEINAYFTQRATYLTGTAETIDNANPGVMSDEAEHREAIANAGVEWLKSYITIDTVGYWDSHAEAIVEEQVFFCVNGVEQTETITHTMQLGLIEDGRILIVCDGYLENATGFRSCSYIPPEDLVQ